MQVSNSISAFFIRILDDPRISPVHISLYMAVLDLWIQNSYENPISVFSHEAMPLAKISGIATYYRTIRELHQFGYIQYTASFNHFQGSQIYLTNVEKNNIQGKVNSINASKL